MPRYFFNVKDGKDIPDDEGTELAGVVQARTQAILTAGEMIRSDGATVRNGSDWRMNVTDEAGIVSLRSAFRRTITAPGPRRILYRLAAHANAPSHTCPHGRSRILRVPVLHRATLYEVSVQRLSLKDKGRRIASFAEKS